MKDSLKELLDELGTLENFRTMTDEEVLNKAQDQARRELRKEVIEAIDNAFWDGIEQGSVEDGGELFNVENYLPKSLLQREDKE